MALPRIAMGNSRVLLALCAVVATAWLALEGLRPKANWISMECPPMAIPGRSFPIRLQLASPVPQGRLGVDLHAQGSSSSHAAVVAVFQTTLNTNQTEYHIEIPLRPTTTAGTVRAVLYASPNGTWKDRFRSAISDDIQVHAADAAGPDPYAQAARISVFHLGGPSLIPRVRFLSVRIVTSLLWVLAALLAVTLPTRSGPSAAPTPPGIAPGPRRALALVTSMAAIAEVIDVSGWLGGLARAAARRVNAYESRQAGQQFVSALALGLVVLATAALLRSRLPVTIRVAAVAAISVLGLIGLDSLSLHAFDEIAESMVLGIPAIQLASLLGAAIAVISLVRWRMIPNAGVPPVAPQNDR